MQKMNEDEMSTCEICFKKFRKEKYLLAHMRSHLVPKAIPCRVCGEIFLDAAQLQSHLSTHMGENTHRCTHCKKLYARKATLEIHMRLHLKDRKFECSKCGKINGTKYDLECHMRTHTGEKPYSCEVCDPQISFTTPSSLSRHMRTHCKEKPFKCQECGKSFTRRDQYIRHINKHMEFHCQICNFHFSSYRKFSTHRKWCMQPTEIIHVQNNPVHKYILAASPNKHIQKEVNIICPPISGIDIRNITFALENDINNQSQKKDSEISVVNNDDAKKVVTGLLNDIEKNADSSTQHVVIVERD